MINVFRNRGWENRTPAKSFGDSCHTTWPIPYLDINNTKVTIASHCKYEGCTFKTAYTGSSLQMIDTIMNEMIGQLNVNNWIHIGLVCFSFEGWMKLVPARLAPRLMDVGCWIMYIRKFYLALLDRTTFTLNSHGGFALRSLSVQVKPSTD